MRENVLLRVDLQKRTVELGAVSSLLTACYDAVLELDQHLKLTQDAVPGSLRLFSFCKCQSFGHISTLLLFCFTMRKSGRFLFCCLFFLIVESTAI